MLIALALAVGLAPVVAGQSTSRFRTPWGDPDLQGVWSFATITPLERPKELAGKEVMTAEEAARWEREFNLRQNRDLIDPSKGGAQYPPGGVVPYNEFWYDRGSKVVGTRRTSLIVDPADGRLPAFTPDVQRRVAARPPREDQRGRPKADSYTDRPLSERCIVMGDPAPLLPGPYNNNVQLFQTPQHVVIFVEQIHDARIVPLDGRPHVTSQVRQWLGSSRGRWEGDTLVVETTNFNGRRPFRESGDGLHLVERFTRLDADTLEYSFTVTDPSTWARPWTAQLPLTRADGRIYEYACHEGNHGLPGVLGGARADEKAAQARRPESR
jgi:hypothetical protein